MAIGQTITAPSCPGTLTSSFDGATYSLLCSQAWESKTGYLIDSTQQTQIELLLNQSGIDWDAVELTFSLGLVLYATGAGIGLFLNLLRKAKV